MAAVIQLRTGQSLAPDGPSSSGPHAAGPQLRLIHGGRSPVARSMRRTFLLRRAVVLAVALVVLWVLVQVVQAALMPVGAEASPVAPPGSVHLVQSGDTLWQLAAAVDPDADPRDVVDRIIELNQGSGAVAADGTLRAGAELRLPSGS